MGHPIWYHMIMKSRADELLIEALRLPVEARAALAGSLIDSLDESVDEDAEAAWAHEIDRRVQELDRGAVRTIPWSEARQIILKSVHDTGRR